MVARHFRPAGPELASLRALRRFRPGSRDTAAAAGRGTRQGPDAALQTQPTPTLATISANAYVWGYNFVLPKAAMSALQDGGTRAFDKLLGAIPAEVESAIPLVEAYLGRDLASAQAVDRGAGVYLTATWNAPDEVAAAPTDWGAITAPGPKSSNESLVCDVTGGSTNPGTPIHLWNYSGSANQMWTYVNNYLLSQNGHEMVMEVSGSEEGAAVQINNYTGALNQQWSIVGDGFVRNLLNGKVLDYSGGVYAPSTPVIAYDPKYPPVNSDNIVTNQWWYTPTSLLDDANYLATVITNDTPNHLYVVGHPIGNTSLESAATQPLPSGSVAVYVTFYGSNNEIDFDIWDPNYSTTNSVASFHAHQDWSFLANADLWADTFNEIGKYSMKCDSSDWYGDSHKYGNPGIIVCSVQYYDGGA